MKGVCLSSSFLTVILLATGIEARATIRRVPTDYSTIQQAINASVNGDTVLVAPGTYVENINFLGKAITVTSEAGPQLTIVDGNRNGSVATFDSGESPASVLRGFTLKNGRIVPSNGFLGAGGGINIMGSSPTITGNIVTANQSSGFGGGISVSKLEFASVTPSPSITDNTISGNNACEAAGIAILAGSPLVQGNIIDGNFIGICSGGRGGGGILIQSIPGAGAINAQIVNNVVTNNLAQNTGGAGGIDVGYTGFGTQIVSGNIIRNNTGGQGGGLYVVYESIVVQNLIVGNHSFQGGGILVDSGSGSKFVNNTIADNTAIQGGGVFAYGVNIHEFMGNVIIAAGKTFYGAGYNPNLPTIFKDNNVLSLQGPSYEGTFPDQTGVNGNISADPLFVNPAAVDYHLRSGSPSIDAGDNSAPYLPATDLDGNPRIQDGNGDGIAIVDMGAYEASLPFDICIQDESNGSIFKFNSTTGNYQFTNCSGFSLNGVGGLIQRGGIITLQHYASDRRVLARIDTSVNKGTASIQLFSPSTTFTITDRNTANNTCACTAH